MAFNLTTASDQLLSTSSASTPASVSVSAQIGIAILTLAFVLGFPGNLFVIWSVCCRVKNRSVTCLLVLNLAAADAFVLLSAPLFLRYLAGGRGWEFGLAACKLVHYLSSVNMYVSIYLICLMSMDRWLAVTRPFLSQRMRTKRSLLVILLGIWIMAFILSLPMPFYRRIQETSLSYCIPHWSSKGHRVFQYLFETIMACLLPFTFILTCYSSVFRRLRSAMFQRKGQSSRLILLIVGTFALFWLPYHIVNITEIAGLLQDSEAVINATETARPNVTAFAYFSSAVNPVLYVFAGSSHIRRAGLSFMAKLFEATNSESASSFSRSTRKKRSGSTPDKSSALRMLPVKLAKPFVGGQKEKDSSTQSKEVESGSELKPLASLEHLE
ncbi:leukotriene B4 receptor 1-like [Polymixia lowei]